MTRSRFGPHLPPCRNCFLLQESSSVDTKSDAMMDEFFALCNCQKNKLASVKGITFNLAAYDSHGSDNSIPIPIHLLAGQYITKKEIVHRML